MEQNLANKKMRMVLLIMGLAYLFSGTTFIINSIYQHYTYGRTVGVVVDFVATTNYNRYSGIDPKIRFVVKDRSYDVLVKYSTFTNPFLRVGEKVKILYSPKSPSSKITIDSFSSRFGFAIFFTTLGLVFLVIARSIKANNYIG